MIKVTIDNKKKDSFIQGGDFFFDAFSEEYLILIKVFNGNYILMPMTLDATKGGIQYENIEEAREHIQPHIDNGDFIRYSKFDYDMELTLKVKSGF